MQRNLLKLFVFILIFMSVSEINAQAWKSKLPQKAENEYTFFDYQKAFNDYWKPYNVDGGGWYIDSNGNKRKASGWKQFKRQEEYWEKRINQQTGEFPKTSAMEQYKKWLKENPQNAKSASGNWSSIGPANTDLNGRGTGRINCVTFDPSDNNHYWVGAPAGGVWETTNNGSNWTVLTDDNAVLGVSDICLAQDYNSATNPTIYIATGDRDGGSLWGQNGGQSHDNESVGVLKSTDGGSTWNTTGLSFNVSSHVTIGRIIAHTSNNTTLWAATSNGIYKSGDAGASWTLKQSGKFIDMEMKPGDNSILYASTSILASSTHPAIYRSTDGGENWTQIKTWTIDEIRCELAVSANNANVVYAAVSLSDYSNGYNEYGGLEGIYRSTNSGASFTKVYDGTPSGSNLFGWKTDKSDDGGQGGYDLAFEANPSDANELYIGGVNSYKSTNASSANPISFSAVTCWTSSTYYNKTSSPVVHADHHMAKYRADGALFDMNDGGVYYTTDGGANWTEITPGLVNGQLYGIGVAQDVTNEIIGGFQDNGTKRTTNASYWYDVKGGDGMNCAINKSDHNVQYGTYTNGQIDRTTNDWGSSSSIRSNTNPADADWAAPLEIDPAGGSTLYFGDSYVKYYDGSWHTLSAQLSPSADKFLQTLSVYHVGATLVIYTGDKDQVWKSNTSGGSYTDVTSNLPTTYVVTDIEIDYNDPDHAWVTFGGYDTHRVYETTNGGGTWTDISAGLPSLPCMTIVQNDHNTTDDELYVGTDVGIYVKVGSANWAAFDNNLPNVVVSDLEIYYDNADHSNDLLYAGTFGRGVWKSDLYSVPANPPTITSVSPNNFFADKGKTLTIDGTDLAGATAVIGGVSGTVTSNNGTTMVVDFPAGKYTNNTLTVDNGTAPAATTTVTVNTRNTIPVGGGTDYHTTIQSALDGLNAWKTTDAFVAPINIEIYAATYTENVSLNSQLNPTSTNYLEIKPHATDAVLVNASGNTYGFNLSTVDYVYVTALTVYDATSDNIYVKGDNCKVSLCKLYGATNSGVKLETGASVTIENNLFYGNDKYGIHILSSNNNTIKNNTFDDNGGSSPGGTVELLNQDFETSTTGWGKHTKSGTNGWTVASGIGVSSSNCAVVDDGDTFEGWVSSPAITIPAGVSSIDIQYEHRTDYNTAYNTVWRLEKSIAPGNTDADWTTINSWTASGDHPTTYTTVNESTAVTAGSDVYLGWYCENSNKDGLRVDNIIVSYTQPAVADGAGLYVESGTGNSVQNNIFNAKSGNDAFYALKTESGITVSSDYNTYYTSNTNRFDYDGTVDNTGPMQSNDIATDPKFVSSSDYHIFSTDGSYHNGEWPPLTTASGTWTNDASDSPALDTGNPADSYANEPSAGGRINQGAYGNTLQASKSISCSYPTTQASNLAITPHETSLDLSWTNGNGDKVIVVAHEAAAVDSDPIDGTSYTANSTFSSGTQIGTGNYVIYDGTGTSMTVTGLNANTTYYFAVYAYNSAGNCYMVPAHTGNKLTLPAQPSVITGNTTVCENSSQSYSVTNVSGITYNWTFPAGWTQTAGGTTNSITVTASNTSGNVQVTPSNASGNGTARTLAVTVNPLPVAPTSVSASPTSLSSGSNTTLSYTGGSGDTFEWYSGSCGGTSVGSGNNLSVTVNATTTYYGRWENSCGVSNCESVTVTVVALSWDGSVSSDWQDVDNWTPAQIPTSSDDITIPNGMPNYPIVDDGATVAVCKDMTIENASSVTIAVNGQMTVSGSITNNAGNTGLVINSDATGTGSLIQNTAGGVDATVNTYLAASPRQWHMVGSPIVSAPVSVFASTSNLYEYDESVDDYWTGTSYDSPVNGWTTFNSGNMAVNKGYLFNYYVNTLNYTGQLNPNTSTSSITINYTDNGGTAANGSDYNDFDGWNFIANPYTSVIDWNNAGINKVAAHIDGAVYCYDGANSQYTSWIDAATHTNGGTQYIPAGQGFFVKANDASGVALDIPSGALVHSTQSYWKSGTPVNFLKLKVEGNNFTDETIVRFKENATVGHDSEFDAYKLFSHGTNVFQIYTKYITPTEYAINTLPNLLDEEQIIVSLKLLDIPDVFVIKATEFNFDNIKVYLKDNELNTLTEINENSEFDFTNSDLGSENRFEIVFEKQVLGVSELDKSVVIYPNPNNGNFFIAINNANKNYNVEIINAIGQIIYTNEFNKKVSELNMKNQAKGVYFVKIKFEDNSIINKKIIIE